MQPIQPTQPWAPDGPPVVDEIPGDPFAPPPPQWPDDAHPSPPGKVDAQLVAASVQIENGLQGASYGGSGTCVAMSNGCGLIITVRHLFYDGGRPMVGNRITVTFPSGRKSNATYIGVDSKADLAAIVIDADANTPVVPIGTREATQGTPVVQIGYPQRIGPKVRLGYSQGYQGWYGQGTRDLIVGVRTDHGDSGSGVFHAADKSLCGVIWGGPNITYSGNIPTWGPQPSGVHSNATGLADIRRFYTEKCAGWPFKRKPKPTTPPGTPPGPDTPPIDPAPDLTTLLAKFKDVEGRLTAIDAIVKDWQTNKPDLLGKVQNVGGAVATLQKDLDGLKQVLPDHGARLGKAEQVLANVQDGLAKVQGLHDALNGAVGQHGTLLQKLQGQLGQNGGLISGLNDKLSQQQGVLGDVGKLLASHQTDLAAQKANLDAFNAKAMPIIDAVKPAVEQGLLAKLPAIAGAAGLSPLLLGTAIGLPGVGIPALALWLFSVARKVKQQSGGVVPALVQGITPATPMDLSPVVSAIHNVGQMLRPQGAMAPLPPSVPGASMADVSAVQAPRSVLDQQVRTVTVPGPDLVGNAYSQAVQKYIAQNPNSSAGQVIEEMKEILLSGKKLQ